MRIRQVVTFSTAALVLGACAPRQVVHEEPSPCAEPLYLRLKSAAPDSLSEREWTRLQDLERACQSTRSSAEHRDGGGMMGMKRHTWWAMTALMAGGAAMWLMMGWWR